MLQLGFSHNRRFLVVFFFALVLSLSVQGEGEEETFAIDTKAGSLYWLPNGPTTEEQKATFDTLSPSSQESFRKNRELLIAKAARGLDKAFSINRVQKTLDAIDAHLWTNAAVISGANELGVSVEAGVSGGLLVNKTGWFGITGPAVTLAADRENKGLVLEFYQDLVRTRRALPFEVGASVFAGVLLSANRNDWKTPLRVESGQGFCSFGAAGCVTENNLRLGISEGIGVGFPPVSVITNDVYRVPILRVGVFRQPPYVKFQVIGKAQLGAFVKKPLTALKQVAAKCASSLAAMGAEK